MIACTFISSSALAQATSTEPLGDFMHCGKIVSDTNRLACFDDAYTARTQGVPETKADQETGLISTEEAVVPISQPDTKQESIAQAAVEAGFGFPRPADPDALKGLRKPVTRVDRNSRNMLLIYLENGQVWVQSESRSHLTPELPLVAEIKPGKFGGYFLSFEGWKQRMKVKRIQ